MRTVLAEIEMELVPTEDQKMCFEFKHGKALSDWSFELLFHRLTRDEMFQVLNDRESTD